MMPLMKSEDIGRYRGHRVALEVLDGGIEELAIAWTDWVLILDAQAFYLGQDVRFVEGFPTATTRRSWRRPTGGPTSSPRWARRSAADRVAEHQGEPTRWA